MKVNKLTSEDLMIDDWIIGHHPSRPKSFGRVSVGILHTMQEQEYGHINENSPMFRIIEPIPLTPEILEKNGFKVEFYNDYKVYELNNFKVCKNCCDYFEVCDLWDDSDWGWRIINFCPCIYVHELQHALKLCGIDKEIVV